MAGWGNHRNNRGSYSFVCLLLVLNSNSIIQSITDSLLSFNFKDHINVTNELGVVSLVLFILFSFFSYSIMLCL